MGREAASSAAEGLGQFLREFDIFLLLDAASHGDDDVGLREVDGLLGFFEDFLRLIADHAVGDVDVDGFYGRGACAGFDFVSSKRAVLERHEPWRFAGEAHVSGQFALEHLARERRVSRLLSCSRCSR